MDKTIAKQSGTNEPNLDDLGPNRLNNLKLLDQIIYFSAEKLMALRNSLKLYKNRKKNFSWIAPKH